MGIPVLYRSRVVISTVWSDAVRHQEMNDGAARQIRSPLIANWLPRKIPTRGLFALTKLSPAGSFLPIYETLALLGWILKSPLAVEHMLCQR